MDKYSVYSDFDIEKYKQTYVNYLEVVIDENGKVMYAVPSHQEKVIAMACEKLGVSRKELSDMCPKEYYFDYMTWLCMKSKAVAVWNDGCVAPEPNKKQVAVLRKLKLNGLYKGAIPNIS